MPPLVSVVIPLYNKEPWIARAVDSVLAQTFEDWELLVVDDGSTDNGPAIVAKYDDPRIRVVQQENAGVSAARNRGILEARGSYVAFLDADDEWKDRFLAVTVDLLDSHPKAVFATTGMTIHGRSRIPSGISTSDGVIPDLFDAMVTHGMAIPTSSTVLARRQSLVAAGMFPVGVTQHEDWDTWLRLAFLGDLCYSSNLLAVYHKDDINGAARGNLGRTFIPQYAISLEAWLSEGRVPENLQSSAKKYVATVLRDDIICLFDECHLVHAIRLHARYRKLLNDGLGALAELFLRACRRRVIRVVGPRVWYWLKGRVTRSLGRPSSPLANSSSNRSVDPEETPARITSPEMPKSTEIDCDRAA